MNTDYRINYSNSITLTPRYESGLSGLYFPIYVNFEGDVELGTAIRYGPFSVGTHSLGSLLFSEKKSLGHFQYQLETVESSLTKALLLW